VSKGQEDVIPEVILSKLRSRTGSKYRLENTFNELVSKESIRKFVDGIGDPNPLWCDEKYAEQTRYGGIVAPPSWLFSVFGLITLEMQGIPTIPAGSEWEFYKPLRVGDKIGVDYSHAGLETKHQGKLAVENHEALYYNQKNELVAKAKFWVLVTEGGLEQVAAVQQAQIPYPWSNKELTRIEEEVLSEPIRGNHTRYWEDVEIGEELPPVVKGPLGVTDMVAYLIGAGPVRITAHGVTLRLLREHPVLAARDPDTFSPEIVEACHFNRELARTRGMKTGFCFAGQNQSWLIHMLTNWMGDDGWLKGNYAQYRGFIYFSDVVWFKGKVTKKYIDENDECCVDIENSAVVQRGDTVILGYSTVILPSKDKKTWPVDKRLSGG